MDAKIVEVALFFQKELLQAQQPVSAATVDMPATAAISVLLLSADNAQVCGHTLPHSQVCDLGHAY